MTTLLTPPRLPDTVGPHTPPSKRRISFGSLLGISGNLKEIATPATTGPNLEGPVTIHALAHTPLTLRRDEGTAAVRILLSLDRAGVLKGHIGLDASDRLCVLKADGTTVVAYDDAGVWRASTAMRAPEYRDTAGTKVLGTQGAAVADASVATPAACGGYVAGSPGDPATQGDLEGPINAADCAAAEAAAAMATATSAVNAVNALIARLEAHGIIAT